MLRSSNFKEDNDKSYLVVQEMSSKEHKEVHGTNKRHVANTAGMEQRSKYQNELTKKSESAIIQRNPIGDRELVGVLPHHRW